MKARSPAVSRPRRLPWAELLRRVFAQDVLPCACGGRRTVMAFVAEANLTPPACARASI